MIIRSICFPARITRPRAPSWFRTSRRRSGVASWRSASERSALVSRDPSEISKVRNVSADQHLPHRDILGSTPPDRPLDRMDLRFGAEHEGGENRRRIEKDEGPGERPVIDPPEKRERDRPKR